MMRAILCATLPLVLLFLNEAHSQTDSTVSNRYGSELGKYSVGFTLLEANDYSRAGVSSLGGKILR